MPALCDHNEGGGVWGRLSGDNSAAVVVDWRAALVEMVDLAEVELPGVARVDDVVEVAVGFPTVPEIYGEWEFCLVHELAVDCVHES